MAHAGKQATTTRLHQNFCTILAIEPTRFAWSGSREIAAQFCLEGIKCRDIAEQFSLSIDDGY
jgi:hypothetical protein